MEWLRIRAGEHRFLKGLVDGVAKRDGSVLDLSGGLDRQADAEKEDDQYAGTHAAMVAQTEASS
jgi:hypothetical protein